MYGSLVFLDERQLTEWFSSKGLRKTEFGHRIGMFLSKAAKIVTLVINLNLHFMLSACCSSSPLFLSFSKSMKSLSKGLLFLTLLKKASYGGNSGKTSLSGLSNYS